MKLYRKVYGVFGMVEWSTLIPMGSGNIRIDFSNGSMTERGIDPATFSTENRVVQMAIEESAKFKSKKISIVEAYEIGELEEKVEEKESFEGGNTEGAGEQGESGGRTGANESTEGGDNGGQGEQTGVNTEGGDNGGKKFPDVKNSQQAKEILLGEPFNIALAELGNKSAILTKAEVLGVSFPNWK